MAPKRPAQVHERPPPADSSDSETDNEEEEESESDDEGEEEQEPQKQNPIQKRPSSPVSASLQSKPRTQQQPSSSETESGSDSDTESESPRYSVKPSKPMEAQKTPKEKKPDSESPAATSSKPMEAKKPNSEPPTATPPKKSSGKSEAATPKKSSVKRKLEEEDPKDEKKAKSTKSEMEKKTGEESKKPAFQRVWSAEDEIRLLQGMIDFQDEKGKDPTSNINAFHEYIKNSLDFDVSVGQLTNKIRTLKRKYKNGEGKGNGKDKKPHDQKSFDLSKRIWGSSDQSSDTPKANGTLKRSKTSSSSKDTSPPKSKVALENGREAEEPNLISFECLRDLLHISGTALDTNPMTRAYELLGESKKAELLERWKEVQFLELQSLAERAALVRDTALHLAKAYKNI